MHKLLLRHYHRCRLDHGIPSAAGHQSIGGSRDRVNLLRPAGGYRSHSVIDGNAVGVETLQYSLASNTPPAPVTMPLL